MPRSPQNIRTLRKPSPRGPKPSAPPTNANDREGDLRQRFSRALTALGFFPGDSAALAVSGGGDSVALMHLFADWAKREKVTAPAVLIVDHGLSSGSEKDAARVAQWAQAIGLNANILRWQGRKPASNIEDRARDARYGLLGEWCVRHGATNLFLAHTREDQAETFLLRLGRGSGIDGLSGMRVIAPLPVPGFTDLRVLRPLLDAGRAELRDYLLERGARWLEDPMNRDTRFARVRIRKALPELEQAGIPARRIVEAAHHLARAREALEAATEEFLGNHARLDDDFALLDGAALGRAHREIGLRALSAVLMRVAGARYRPRFERLEALFDAILSGELAARTLSGCRVGHAPKARAAFGPATLLIAREPARKAGLRGINVIKTGPPDNIARGQLKNSAKLPQKGRNRPI